MEYSPFEKKLKLVTSISLNNIHAYNKNNIIHKPHGHHIKLWMNIIE